ncbi:MAG: hypothetical protein SW833_06700 [Cyanobacteriota bacterium]|nr:hypothetical protein [Cyanobacteriota bacterium]
MLRLDAPFLVEAMEKAQSAYAVIEPLKEAILYFQRHPEYRDRCFESLAVKHPERILEGCDRLATDLGLSPIV